MSESECFSDDIDFEYEEDDLYLSGTDDQFEEEVFEETLGPNRGDQDNGRNIISDSDSKEFLSPVKYRAWTTEDFIRTHFYDKCRRLQDQQLPQCDFDEILVMLQVKNWQEDNVINAYYDNKEEFFKECGFLTEGKNSGTFESMANFTCPICCEEGDLETYSLVCGHRYCVACYVRYLGEVVHDGNVIRCPGCSMSLGNGDIETMLRDKQDQNQNNLLEFPIDGKFDELHISTNFGTKLSTISEVGPNNSIFKPNFNVHSRESEDSKVSGDLQSSASQDHQQLVQLVACSRLFIEQQNRYKWCPVPDCPSLIEYPDFHPQSSNVNLANVPIVICSQNHEFCYSCLYENHLPCPCWLVELWIKKCQDDSETVSWIQANTQACPQCSAQIEKNGGCNHMSCKKCKFDFCWICLKDWKEHGQEYYRCNRFDPKTADSIKKFQQLKRLSLQRYLHFYKRFTVHESSMRGDQITLDRVDNKMKEYMLEELKKQGESKGSTKGKQSHRLSLSWIDVQFLHDAIRQLTNGRKTLKWTYCFAFYLLKTNFAEIFELMQDYLNKTVEDLSRIFEEINDRRNNESSSKLIMKHKKEIINLSNLVAQRQAKLVDCAYSGLQQGLLKFETREE